MSKFTPGQFALLDKLYALGGDAVPGAWLVDGSVTVSKLDVSALDSRYAPASFVATVAAAGYTTLAAVTALGYTTLATVVSQGYLTSAPYMRRTEKVGDAGWTTVTLSTTPYAGSVVMVTHALAPATRGTTLQEGAADGFTIAGDTVTLTAGAPGVGDIVQVFFTA